MYIAPSSAKLLFGRERCSKKSKTQIISLKIRFKYLLPQILLIPLVNILSHI